MSGESAETTEHLVARAQRGERAALAALARGHLRSAYAVALAVVGRPQDAEDVAQEALVAAFEKIETCREPGRFTAWLLQIARNRARNWRAQRALREVGPGAAPAGREIPDPTPLGDPGLREALVAALAEIPEVQREIVLLHDLVGFTHSEIAAGVGISETMSRQHLFQARRRLRALLGGDSGRIVGHDG